MRPIQRPIEGRTNYFVAIIASEKYKIKIHAILDRSTTLIIFVLTLIIGTTSYFFI